MNPWPGKELKVVELPGRTPVKATKVEDGERYRFAAESGREYELGY